MPVLEISRVARSSSCCSSTLPAAAVRVGGQILVSLVCVFAPVVGLGPGSKLRARSFFVFFRKPT